MTVNDLAELHPLGVARWLHEPQSTMLYPDRRLHIMWGGIDPWDHRLGARFVGIVEIWKDF